MIVKGGKKYIAVKGGKRLRKLPWWNIRFMGLGNSLLTPTELVQNTTLTTGDIAKWYDDGTDLYLFVNKKFVLTEWGSIRTAPSAVQTKINSNCTGIDDFLGLITEINSNTLYDCPNEIKLRFNGVTTIGSEGLRNVNKCVYFRIPKLESVGAEGLRNLGVSNGGLILAESFENLSSFGVSAFSQTRLSFKEDSPLVTGEISLFRNPNAIQFPFENCTGVESQGFRECFELKGEVNLLGVTSTDGSLLFFGARKVTKVDLSNCTSITSNSSTFRGMDSITEIDIRSCTSFGDATSDANCFFQTDTSNLTIHANTALQTANAGGVHASIQQAINGGAIVNWY